MSLNLNEEMSVITPPIIEPIKEKKPRQKRLIRYDYNYLQNYCKERNITLIKDYSKEIITIHSVVEGKCLTENCVNIFNKQLMQILLSEAYCKKCSKINAKLKYKKTCMDKYNVENLFQLKECKEKIEKTCETKYGVKHCLQNKEIKERFKKTCNDRYGSNYPMQNKEIREKSKKTCLLVYGVEYSMQNKEIQEKTKQTCLKKYNCEYVAQNKEVQKKIRQTCVEKYGTDHHIRNENVIEKRKQTCWKKFGTEFSVQNEEVKEKMKQTCISKYGVEYRMQNAEIMDKHIKNCYKSKNFTFPSGKCVKVQGYEPFALNDLIQNEKIEETDIITGCQNVPEIWYKNTNNRKCRYYVDIFIPSQNKMIEVKSTWTFKTDKDITLLKQQACKENNFYHEIWIYDEKGNKIECHK